jgi:MoxR-like ATPase
MSDTYLDGRVTISCLATPTKAEQEILASLSDEESEQLLQEALSKADMSGSRVVTAEEIRSKALARLRDRQLSRQDAL